MTGWTFQNLTCENIAGGIGGQNIRQEEESWREQLLVAAILSVLLTLEGFRFLLVHAINLLIVLPIRLLMKTFGFMREGGQVVIGQEGTGKRFFRARTQH